jgi:hypothetical protein
MKLFNWFCKKKEDIDIQVGYQYVDKVWGDTIIEITMLNENKKDIRYKYLQVEGILLGHSSINIPPHEYSTNTEHIERHFKRYINGK